MSPRLRITRLLVCTLGLALIIPGPLRAADILFIVDDDNGQNPPAPDGIPDKGSIDAGSDTNEGPNARPVLGLRQRMQNLGHTVTVLDERADAATVMAAAANKQLVVISSSVGSGNIPFEKFGPLVQPILNMEPASFDNLRMSSVDSVVDNNVTSINIVNPTSPLAAGKPAGVHDVNGPVNLLPPNNTAPGAIVVAQGGTDNRVAIFDIPQGALLTDNTPAAGRRIGFFWNANGINYNDNAGQFFDTAVQNAIPEPGCFSLAALVALLAVGRRRRGC